MSGRVRVDAELLVALFEATLLALGEVENPATKASLMHKLIRTVPDGERALDVQDLLRNAGVFDCALGVLASVGTLDPSDEDRTDVVETVCSLIRAATDGNRASQAAASAAGLGPILIDLERNGLTNFIRSAAGAALIGMDSVP